MKTGTYISGICHLFLVAWVMLSATFQSEPTHSFAVQEVTLVSTTEFAAIGVLPQQPDVLMEAPNSPDLSTFDSIDPQVMTSNDQRLSKTQPDVTETVQPDNPPVNIPLSIPVDPIIDSTLEITPPEPSKLPALSSAPQPPNAERIAPEVVAPPPIDVTIGDLDQDAIAPLNTKAETVEEPQEETAREEATTEIVTEAEESDISDVVPVRPLFRPRELIIETQESDVDEQDIIASAVADAIADVMISSSNSNAQQSQPGSQLSSHEQEAFRLEVGHCWNVGSLSTEALQTKIVVSVLMRQDTTPIEESIKLQSYSGGTRNAADKAFGVARRAIIRCGKKGYNLPVEKYETWREIEIEFNPEQMRNR
ncbi:MAG: energy transducer TonB [Aestuariivita sp.]|nr:energy transducer TonB [Aestuariivita sp.]